VKIIALERETPGVTTEQFKPYLMAEAVKLWDLYQAGLVRESYFRQDLSTAVLVLECTGLDEARAKLGELPLVQAGLIDFDLIPLKPYPGFARLFISFPEGKSTR
jgi:hypothetical protein